MEGGHLPLRVDGVGIRHFERADTTPERVFFEVRPGEVVLLLGPSGSGKSTLALALNGLIPQVIPATLVGSVSVAGIKTTDAPVSRLSEHVSMVFQDPDAQIVTASVLDEVCFGPENQLVGREEVVVRAERALRQVGLWDRRDDDPAVLSGGGRQRLAIACALSLGSPLMVLDEPTANLDPVGIAEVYSVLGGLVRDGRHSIVLIEHNLDAAIGLVDRVVVFDGSGRQVLSGPVREVIVGHARELVELGVWLPVATLAALRLREAGVRLDPLPLTPAELTAALDAQPELPAVAVLVQRPRFGRAASGTGARSSAVSVRGLSVARGGHEVLRNIRLEIGRGDFVAIVGVNGVGKSTLLQSIAGILRPPRGAIAVGGLDPAIADARALARTIGFVFQNPEHQFVRATVEDELAHTLEQQRMAPADIRARVDAMLARFGLVGVRDQHPFLLSGGQKRRLSVGAVLIAGAPVLALDEPTFGQDRARAVRLLDLVAGLRAEGTTVVMVTHDMQLVADYASHVAVLADGRVAGFDETSRVFSSGLIESAGLLPPPLVTALRGMRGHPDWQHLTRLGELPTVGVA